MTSSLTPIGVIGLTSVQSIAVGSIHTCARTTNGLPFCWGENRVNQIGDGTTTTRPLPVSVAGFVQAP